jgi:hypothetical protein
MDVAEPQQRQELGLSLSNRRENIPGSLRNDRWPSHPQDAVESLSCSAKDGERWRAPGVEDRRTWEEGIESGEITRDRSGVIPAC